MVVQGCRVYRTYSYSELLIVHPDYRVSQRSPSANDSIHQAGKGGFAISTSSWNPQSCLRGGITEFQISSLEHVSVSQSLVRSVRARCLVALRFCSWKAPWVDLRREHGTGNPRSGNGDHNIRRVSQSRRSHHEQLSLRTKTPEGPKGAYMAQRFGLFPVIQSLVSFPRA